MPGVFSSKLNILFDLDGTLIDSDRAHENAYVEALRVTHPTKAEHFDYLRYAGQPTRQVFQELGFFEQELEELVDRKQERYRLDVSRGEVIPFPGVEALLADLRNDGRRIFLVTGGSWISVERILKMTRLECFFEAMITGDDVNLGKPDPEPFLMLLKRHCLEASECVVIEDGESGIRSARAAGLDTIGVHDRFRFPGITYAQNIGGLRSLLT